MSEAASSRAARQGARHAREGRPCAPSNKWSAAQVDEYLKGYTSEPNPGKPRRPMTATERAALRMR